MAKAMREPTFWILTALAQAARHGYGIIREVTVLSGGLVTLQAGTLYAALDRLTAEGLVEVDHDEKVDGRDRRYYRLTSGGVAALNAEVARLESNARTAVRQLAARRPDLGPATAFRAATALGPATVFGAATS
ncbi:PadR family transcriptional regulator [Actinoplanes sp. CA-030573]|uniref:PadR family transcriptional regulator n=1 Tax=Actinoplanes sp. CA-030573 TaxID=3239898 RepID=UPI003D918A27